MELPVRTLLWLRVDDLDTVGHTLAGHDEVAFAAATTGPADIFASVDLRPDLTALYRYLTTAVAALPGVEQVETAPGPATGQGRGHPLPAPPHACRVVAPSTVMTFRTARGGREPSLHQPGHRYG